MLDTAPYPAFINMSKHGLSMELAGKANVNIGLQFIFVRAMI